MTKRTKLAEAIGTDLRTYKCSGTGAVSYDFSPFTDANDDYAVLEWLRASHEAGNFNTETWGKCASRIAFNTGLSYQIGDYARAALKVLDVD